MVHEETAALRGEKLRRQRTGGRRVCLALSTLALGLAVALVLAEGLLRLFGCRPWVPYAVDGSEPTMHGPDPVLGWRGLAGSYVVPAYVPGGPPTQVTLLERGRRRSSPAPVAGASGSLLLVGDSFTQGWAINDSDTYAWKLQERFPQLEVVNYGTAGYGTYQSLLVLERELPRLPSPRLVLYGFIEKHEARNAAPGSWLEKLSKFSRRGHVAEPFATLEADGELVRHPPVAYPETPLRRSSALVTMAEKSWMDLATRSRLAAARPLTERLLLEMNALVAARETPFAVVLLQAEPEAREHYAAFLKEHGVPVIDCIRDLTEEFKVPGEGHPNGALNTIWAECIAAGLEPFTSSSIERQEHVPLEDKELVVRNLRPLRANGHERGRQSGSRAISISIVSRPEAPGSDWGSSKVPIRNSRWY